MRSPDRVKAAKAILIDLLQFQVPTQEDGEVPVFSEASLYPTLGKDDARCIRGRLSRLCEMLGIRDMDLVASGQKEVEVPTENRMMLWRVSDGLEQASSALQMLQFAVDDLDRLHEFRDRVGYAKEEVEQAAASHKYSKPERIVTRILRALGYDPKTGRLDPSWKPKPKKGRKGSTGK